MSDVPPPNMYSTHCIHGLDLRIFPRCYLCTPRRLEWSEAGGQFVPTDAPKQFVTMAPPTPKCSLCGLEHKTPYAMTVTTTDGMTTHSHKGI